MHIKDLVDYVKREIHFSKEFCEDNVFVTLRIKPIERIIENLEQKDKDNTSYAQDLAEAEFKTNKYDALVEEIQSKTKAEKEEVKHFAKTGDKEQVSRHAYTQDVLEELMPKEK